MPAANPKAGSVLFNLPYVIEQVKPISSQHSCSDLGASSTIISRFVMPLDERSSATNLMATWRCAFLQVKRFGGLPLHMPKWSLPHSWFQRTARRTGALFMDPLMPGEFAGKERTRTQLGYLVSEPDFKLHRVIDTRLNMCLLEVSVA